MKKTSRIIVLGILTLQCAGIVAQEEESKDTLLLKEVVVSGSRIETGRNQVPLSVSVLKRKDVDRVDRSAILPALSENIPGIFVVERAMTGFGVSQGAAGQITIRGVGGTSPNNEVLVMIDGHPQYMGIYGHPIPDAYVASDVEKVEVVKGPSSVLYGSNAMGGVVNIITRKLQKPGPDLSARVAYGSYNTRKYMVDGGYKWKKLSLFASVNRDQTDGERDSSAFKITNGFFKASYQPDSHITISSDVMIASFDAQDPGPVTDPSSYWVEITRGQTSFNVENHYDKTEGGLIAFYNFGKHTLSDGWYSHDGQGGLTLYQGIKLFTGNKLTAGFDYKNTGGKGNSGVHANVWNHMDETAGYLLMQQDLGNNVTVSGGIRLEHNSMYGSEWVPQGGVTWRPDAYTLLRGSVSKGFRNPTIMELYLFSPNPDLKPERVMNYEAGATHYWFEGKLKTDLTLFLLNGDNLIQPAVNPNPPPYYYTRKNTGTIHHKGFEFEASGNIIENVGWHLGYSYLDMKKPQLASPENQTLAGIDWKKGKFVFRLDGTMIGRLYTVLPSEGVSGKTQSYTVLNARVSYKPVKMVEIYLSGRNLLDEDYQILNGYPMPGINFMTGISFNLN